MKPYPKYMDSGVEWLGEIPEGWEVQRTRNLGNYSSSGIDKKSVEGELPVQMFNYLDVYKSKDKRLCYSEELMWTTAPSEKVKEHSVRDGDIIITPSSETADDIGHAARVGNVPANVVYSYHVIRFRPADGNDSNFLTYSFNAPLIRSYFESVCAGTTRMVLGRDDFKNAVMVLPPPAEQQAIAAYLDRETAKIDEAIKATEESIELLKVERKCIISNAVTKGLDPKAKMKDSGIEWLGEIPEGWVVAKTGRFFKVAMGQTILKEDLVDDGEFPVFSATDGDHYFGRINDPRVRLAVGDLVIPARGNSIGAVKLVKEPSTTSQTTIYCKNLALDKILQEYAYYFMRGWKDVLFYFTQTAIPQITVEEVGTNPILIPPLAEQEAIASYLDEKTSQIDALITEKRGLIESLQEYRASLIHEAVTGKIDLREEAA